MAEIGGKSRPLVLRNSEIERFETQYAPLGAFDLLGQFLGRGQAPQVRHCRDLVALGLIGGGMPDRAADDIVSALPPHENHKLRQIASDVLMMAFLPDREDAPKKDDGDGSAIAPKTEIDAGTSPNASETSPPPGSSPPTSAP